MGRYLYRVALVVLPFVILLTVCELSLRRIPNNYRYKDDIMNSPFSSDICILNFGSSHAYWGINPSYLTMPAFNLAFPTQSLRYDHYLYFRYIDRCNSLKYIILPISYNSLRFDLESGPEWNIARNYCIYMGCDYHKGEKKYNYELYGNFNLAMFKTVAGGCMGKINHIGCDSLGFGLYYTLDNRSANWMNEGNGYVAHTIAGRKQVEDNKNRILEIIQDCEDRGICVVLLSTPTYKTYNGHLDKKQYEEMSSFCSLLDSTYNNVKYVDLLFSTDYKEDDFFDADHLNDVGAMRMTKMLDSLIVDWESSRLSDI